MTLIDIPELYTEKPFEEQLAAWETALWKQGYLITAKALPPLASLITHGLPLVRVADAYGAMEGESGKVPLAYSQ